MAKRRNHSTARVAGPGRTNLLLEWGRTGLTTSPPGVLSLDLVDSRPPGAEEVGFKEASRPGSVDLFHQSGQLAAAQSGSMYLTGTPRPMRSNWLDTPRQAPAKPHLAWVPVQGRAARRLVHQPT